MLMGTTDSVSSGQRSAIMLFLAGWTFTLLGAAYFAGAGSSNTSSETTGVTGRSLEEAMPVFTQSARPLSPDVRRIERAVSSTSNGPVANVDFSRARPVPIETSLATAWIAPADDHVCAFIPDPIEGYGTGCVTVRDIELGRGFSILRDDLRVYVVIFVLAGDAPPRIESARGSEQLKATGNAVAVHTLTDSTIRTDHGAIDLGSSQNKLPMEEPQAVVG